MEIITVDFENKRVLSRKTFDVVLEAELEYDFLMNLGEDDEDIEFFNSIGKTSR